ncbi:hypothetical protein DV735_g1990, partial [Chaetothyriales sp. CBS 134920]
MSTPAQQHSIVIIGGSFAGLTAAANLLRDIIPTLPTTTKYKVTVINPSEDFYWKIGAPRIIANPDALPLSKGLLPIRPHFTKYTDEQFELIVGYAQSIDPVSQTVSLLVIASGTGFASNLWSTTGGTDALKAELADIHAQLQTAETIVVAGGGAAGVETAGELGERFSAADGKKRKITLYSGSTQLLNGLANKRVGADAESRLTKLGVDVVNDNIQVTQHQKSSTDGKTVLTLSDGSSVSVDVYIPATGDKPNSSFVPADWLTDRGQVKTDPQTLRLDVPGVKNVYAYGTVASYSNGSIVDVMMAKKPFLETLRNDLSGGEQGPRTKNVYKKITSDVQFVPIGSQQGVGVAFGWKVPSFAVRAFKSKDFMIGNAVKYLDGTA